MNKIVGILIFLTLAFAHRMKAQDFDSAKIYPLCMKSTYRVAIDRGMIKGTVDTVINVNGIKSDSLYFMFQNEIKSKYIRTMPESRSHIDIRLGIEFFKRGKVVANVGVTEKETLYIHNVLYSYSVRKLKRLDILFPGISKLICLD